MGAKVVFLREPQQPAVAATRPRVLVPAEALARDGSQTRVWIVHNGRVSSRAVRLGRERGSGIEVEQGLEGGESVVLRPGTSLRDGAPVRVRPSSS